MTVTQPVNVTSLHVRLWRGGDIVRCQYLGLLGHLSLVTRGARKLEEGVDREPGGQFRPVRGRREGDAAHTLT